MPPRDRILELRRVPASTLRPHPGNWRTHPPAQRAALAAVLSDVGYAGALVARQLPDGSLELIDGHLRAETTPDALVPVLVLDVNEEEAAKLLMALDPLALMAQIDRRRLTELAEKVRSSSRELGAFVRKLADRPPLAIGSPSAPNRPPAPFPEAYQLVVHCRDEAHQRELFDRLTSEGLSCRLLML